MHHPIAKLELIKKNNSHQNQQVLTPSANKKNIPTIKIIYKISTQ
jgi:hypothetical protein